MGDKIFPAKGTSTCDEYVSPCLFPCSDQAVQDQAIDCITDLIKCHDSDTRYDEPSCRARVASLYLPLLGIVIENFSLLHGAPIDDNNSELNMSVFNAISTSSVTSRWGTNDDISKEYSNQVGFAMWVFSSILFNL